MGIKTLLLQLLVASVIGFLLFLATKAPVHNPIKRFAKAFAAKFMLAVSAFTNNDLDGSPENINSRIKPQSFVKRDKI